MEKKKSTFALFFGNKGAFSQEALPLARKEMAAVLNKWGYETLMLDENATAYGGVETSKEGRIYAEFLSKNRGKFDGVILSLPNFGDENGAAGALKEAGVPILVQGYPDELTTKTTEQRRDSFCGKISVMNVFGQYGIPFTALKPHVVSPDSDRFKENIEYFGKVCSVVGGLKNMRVGAIGVRPDPFKTVRIDETTLQQYGIEVITVALSDLFERMKSVSAKDEAYNAKAESLKNRANWDNVPEKPFDALIKLGVALDAIVDEYELDALGLKCWAEMQIQWGISPCVILGDLNERGISAACEVDLGNAIFMKALSMASGVPASCLDWNNNYGDDDDRCNLFHCGPVPPSLMAGKGVVSDHQLISRRVGKKIGFGCNIGRIAPCDMTFGSLATMNGKVKAYIGQGKITDDPLPEDFFGCSGVAHIEKLQDVLLYIGYNGHRHHVSMTSGLVAGPVKEALERYMCFEVAMPQKEGV